MVHFRNLCIRAMNQEVSLRSVTTGTRFRSQGTPNEIRGEESGIALVRVCLRVLGFSSVRMIPIDGIILVKHRRYVILATKSVIKQNSETREIY